MVFFRKRVAPLAIALALSLGSAIPAARAEDSSPWSTAAEAEAARVAAEEKAKALGQAYMELNEAAEEAEADAETAEKRVKKREKELKAAREAAGKASEAEKAEAERKVAEAEKALKDAGEKAEARKTAALEARQAADALYGELSEAAMALKEATEASVRMARTQAISEDRITASFGLEERYSGRFNDRMEPVYLSFPMEQAAKVRIRTSGASLSISVLDSTGSTVLTLIPSSTAEGSVCRLGEDTYTLLVAPIGEEEKNFSILVSECPPDGGDGAASSEDPEEDETDETEMEILVEFD